jgi:hypothetical protein
MSDIKEIFCKKCGGGKILPCFSIWDKINKISITSYSCMDCYWVGMDPLTDDEKKNKKRTELIDKMLT